MRPHRAAEPSERVVECADRLLPRCCVSRRNRFEVLAHHRGQRGIPVNRYLAYLPDDFIGNPQRNVQCRLSPSVDCTIIRLTRNTAPGQHCTGPFFPLSCPSPDDPHRATPNPPAVAESPLRFDYHPLDAWRPAALPPYRLAAAASGTAFGPTALLTKSAPPKRGAGYRIFGSRSF